MPGSGMGVLGCLPPLLLESTHSPTLSTSFSRVVSPSFSLPLGSPANAPQPCPPTKAMLSSSSPF